MIAIALGILPLPHSPLSPRSNKSLSLTRFNRIMSQRASLYARYLSFVNICERIERQRQAYIRLNAARFGVIPCRSYEDCFEHSCLSPRQCRRSIVTQSCCFDHVRDDEGWISIVRPDETEYDGTRLVEDVDDDDSKSISDEESEGSDQFYWETRVASRRGVGTLPVTPASPVSNHRFFESGKPLFRTTEESIEETMKWLFRL